MGAVAYLTLWERKFIGWIQIRIGPEPRRPARPAAADRRRLKLLLKETSSPTNANKGLYLLAPVLHRAGARGLGGDSVLARLVLADINAGLLYIMALSSMGVYGVIVAGWASNSKYAFLGAMRSAAQMVSYELAMGFALVVVLMVSGSLNLSDIVDAQGRGIFAGAASTSCRGTGCRSCRCWWCTSSPASPRPTAQPSTWWKASPRSSPAT